MTSIKTIRRFAVAAAASVMGALLPASAEQVGTFDARCTVEGQPASLSMKYTIYSDVAVVTGPHDLFSDTIDTGDKIIYWEGFMRTVVGNFRLEGKGTIIEAFPVPGHYTDMFYLLMKTTSSNSFNLGPLDNPNGPQVPCQIMGG